VSAAILVKSLCQPGKILSYSFDGTGIGVPVQECDRCSEYTLSDQTMEQIEKLASQVDKAAELEILRYAV